MKKYFQEKLLSFYVLYLSITVVLCAGAMAGTKIYAFLALGWTILGIFVCSWLLGRYTRVVRGTQHRRESAKPALPNRLLNTLHKRQHYDQGLRALKGFNPAFAMLLYMFVQYFLYGAFLVIFAQIPDAFQKINAEVSSLAAAYDVAALQGAFYQRMLLQEFAYSVLPFMLIGIVFWIGQIIALGNVMNKVVFILSLALFLLCLIAFSPYFQRADIMFEGLPWVGYGWGMIDVLQQADVVRLQNLSGHMIRAYEAGLCGAIFMLCLVLGVGVVLVRNLFHSSVEKFPIFCALIILFIMIFVDIYCVFQPQFFALYIGGWALIAHVSVGRGVRSKKVYMLYN